MLARSGAHVPWGSFAGLGEGSGGEGEGGEKGKGEGYEGGGASEG